MYFSKSWSFLYDIAVPLLGIHRRIFKTYAQKNLYTDVHCSIIHNYQKVKHPKCPSADE